MTSIPTLSRSGSLRAVALTACFALGAGATATAQAVPRPASDFFLLVSPRQSTPITIPGVQGALRLDLGSLAVVPGNDAALDAVRRLGSLFTQRLDLDAAGRPGTLSPLLGHGLTLGSPGSGVPAAILGAARRHLDAVRGTEIAPGWDHARLTGAAQPLYRPDVQGPAYWELAVAPRGFIIVATGEHDFPVSHWDHRGRPITRILAQRARAAGTTAARFYKLDSLAYAAEDARGERVATVGSQPNKILRAGARTVGGGTGAEHLRLVAWSSWRELKQDFVASYGPMIADLRARAAAEWRLERVARAGGSTPLCSWSSWTYHYAGSSSDQRNYNQYDLGSCASGCGPTAWAMLFGWGDYRASRNDPTWGPRKGLYRSNGSRTGSSSAVAPRDLPSTGIYNITIEIRGLVDTFCLTDQGATYPWDMGKAQDYLIGRTGARLSTAYNAAGIHETRLRNIARASIVHRDTPCIIGTGWLNHYPLAWKYAWRKKTCWGVTTYQRWFYVNNGWGGEDNGWVPAGTWFAGELLP